MILLIWCVSRLSCISIFVWEMNKCLVPKIYTFPHAWIRTWLLHNLANTIKISLTISKWFVDIRNNNAFFSFTFWLTTKTTKNTPAHAHKTYLFARNPKPTLLPLIEWFRLTLALQMYQYLWRFWSRFCNYLQSVLILASRCHNTTSTM